MAISKKPHCILMFMISLTLVLSAAGSDVSNGVAEAPASASGPGHHDGLLPLAKKHVVIRNVVWNLETLNVHCKSSEDDLGLIHIPWGRSWDFRFHVNISKSTKFRCHFTWYGGGSHYFDIFDVGRDDTPSGKFGVCKECIWEVGNNFQIPMCRINRDGSPPYCFEWDDN